MKNACVVAIIIGIATSVLSAHGQGCVDPAPGLVAWWPAESHATDVVGANNGIVSAGVTFIAGEVGQAFQFGPSNAGVKVPASASLNVGAGAGFTIECWINPQDLMASPLVEWNNGTTYGLHFWVGGFSGPGTLLANLVDGAGSHHYLKSAGGVVQSNMLQHVATTYDKASGVVRLFHNGVMVAQTSLGSVTPNTSWDVFIGTRLAGTDIASFKGIIDEPSIYNRALTTNEIAAIFAAGSTGKCTPGSPPATPPVVIVGPITNGANSHAYLLLSGSTWTEAEAKAVSLGGHLVTINDAAEDDWVFNAFSLFGGTNRHLWIGLSDEVQEGTFVWSSGEPVVYTHWYPGEPNNYNNDDYAHIWAPNQPNSDRRWNDAPVVSVDEIGRPFCGVVEIAGATPPPAVTCLTPPSGLVSWWRGESNTTDTVGGNAAVLANGAGYNTGQVGTGFKLDGVDDYVRVPASGNLNIGPGAGFTLETWINPSDVSDGRPILEWDNDTVTAVGLHLWIGNPGVPAASAYLGANLYDGITDHGIVTASGTIIANTAQHVALTYDRASGTARLFINGVVKKEQSLGSVFPRTTQDLYVGARLGSVQPRYFQGLIDEPSVYNRALTTNEIAAIFAAGSAGKCVLPPTLPTITLHPTNSTVVAGSPAVFNSAAAGSSPLAYQWRWNGTNIAGATNASYPIASAQETQSGLYSVRVTNLFGVAISSNASLTVLPLPTVSCIAPPSGLVSWWRGESNVTDVVGTNTAVLEGGTVFSAGKVGGAFNLDGTDDRIRVPASGSLNIGPGAGYTLEAWINPFNSSYGRPIFEWNNASASAPGLIMWVGHPSIEAGYFGVDFYDGITDHVIETAQGTIVSNVMQHVALTYDRASGVARLFINGVMIKQQTMGSVNARTTEDLYIGARLGSIQPKFFQGIIDEPGVYNRALNTNEIAAIYAASSAGKCVPTPPAAPPAVVYGPITNNGRAYLLLSGSTWAESEAGAVQLGGHLVTINDAVESDWVFTTFGSFGGTNRELWIGLNDAAQEGTFVWSSGEPVTYTRWYPGEPNNFSNDDYTHIWAPDKDANGRWNDSPDLAVDGEGRPFCGVVELTVAGPAPIASIPQITSFSPASGSNGTMLTLVGTNFSAAAASNIVYFGAVRASVTVASPTSLTVIVPSGATYAAPSVTVAGLIGQAVSPFVPMFYNGGATIDSSSFAPKFDLSVGGIQQVVLMGDMDGDGKVDLVTPNATGNSVSVLRNISTNGSLTAGSFAAKVDFPLPGISYGGALADVDGDGKLDIIAANGAAGAGTTVAVLRNTSTPGVINSNSFAPRVDFTTATGPTHVAIGDLDGDGKLDLAVATYEGAAVSILRNTSTPGSINAGSFAAKMDLASGATTFDVKLADLDGDGRRDLVVARYDSGVMTVIRNLSSPGSLSTSSFASNVNFTVGNAYELAVGDLDGDAKPDVAVAKHTAAAVAVLRNVSTVGTLSSNSFAAPVSFTTGSSPHGVAIGDLDGDGKPDLATANETGASVSVLRNTTTPGSINSGSFAAKIDFATASNPVGIAIGDLDGDGRPDLATGLWASSAVSVLRNTVAPTLPTITQSPTNRTVIAGSTTSFSVGVTGSAPLTYQWRWNGTNIDNATNASYSIAAAQESHAGLYSVRVTNLFGAAESSNALLTVLPLPPVPVIYSFAPGQAKAGELVHLVGTNFSSVAESNIVYFGAVRALVTAATATSLDVIVLTGATYAPPSVTVAGLSGQARAPFLPTYLGTGVINGSSFAPKVDFATVSGQATVAVGDLDGDGKPDLVAANFNSTNISVYRNISSNGSITAASFAPRVNFITGSYPYAYIADVDGDGKLDILVANNSNGTGNTISVYRNTSTPGILTNSSFAPRVNFTTATGPIKIVAGDIDGDGKTDLAVSDGNSRVVSLLRNLGTPGIINSNSFAARVDVASNAVDRDVELADLDGDGKLDLLTTYFSAGTVSILRNIATRGSLTTNSFAPRINLAAGSAYNVGIGDLDGDGKLDLIVDNRTASVGVIRNLSTPGNISSNTFATKVSYPTVTEPYAVAIGDVDGDGKPDLAVANANSPAVSVLRNTAAPGTINSNSFAAKVDFTVGSGPRLLALADFDADGRPDLAVANLLSSFVSVLKNTAAVPAPPTFTQQPVNQSAILGDLVTFSANATGAPPISYQWQFNGDNIPGASNTSLTLPEAQLAQVGNYSVVISNIASTTTSSNAALSVTVPGCTPAPAGLVASWSGEGNAIDAAGGNDGPLVGATFVPGKVGQAFNFDGSGQKVTLGDRDALKLTSSLTIEGWIFARANGFILFRGDNRPGLDPYVLSVELTHELQLIICNATGDVFGLRTPSAIPMNQWLHVAATLDDATGAARLFVNGALLAETNTLLRPFRDLDPGSDPGVAIGGHAGGYNYFSFDGVVDELSVYSRALGTNEIADIYATRSTGKCPLPPVVLSLTPPSLLVNAGETASFSALAAGTPPLSYQWQYNGTNITSQTNTSLILPAVQVSQSGSYTVVVTNLAGTASSNAVLTVLPLPKVPVIYSFAPGKARTGEVVQLTGTNFSDGAASNVVYFGAVRAAVTLANPTSLTVIVPVGATYAPPTVTVGGLTAQASASFTPTFPGGGAITNDSFAPRVNLTTGNGPVQTVIADLDGDGKPDLAVTDDYANTISLYRNISIAGTLVAGSFEPRVVLPASLAAYSPYMLVAADVDGDGKLDLVTTDMTGNTVSVFRNVSVPGSLNTNSFAPFVSFAVGAGPRQLAVVDLDADGRPEIVTANYDSSTMSILRNTGSTGQISASSFAPSINLAAGAGTHGLAVTDLDGDGKPDIATANNISATLSLFRNIGSGPLSASSFAPEVQIAAVASAHFLRAADLDGDGKPDLILTSYLSDPLNVYRNQSTVGMLDNTSFAAGVAFALSGRGHTVSAGDLNGDGKVDLVEDTEIGDSVALLQNLSSPGSFTSASLAAHLDLATGWNAWGSSVGDLDGDGHPDVVFANAYEATISICRNLMGDNHAPVADAGATASLVVSLNGSNAVATLNGSHSSDPDGDALTYAWFITGASNAFATGAVASATQPVGTNHLTLVVSDGLATGSQNFTVEVIAADDAFDELRALVRAGHLGPRTGPLLAALRTAENALDHNHNLRAIARLHAFQFWVRALVQPTNPTLASQLIDEAQAIIAALSSTTPPTPHVVTIQSISLGANGRPHLRISGQSGRVYIVEVSTNTADWVPLGEATETSTNTFEFDDNSPPTGAHFYRVVAPE